MANRTRSTRSSGISMVAPPGNRRNTQRRGMISTAAKGIAGRTGGETDTTVAPRSTCRCQYFQSETLTRSRRQNAATISPLASCQASRRRHAASFLRSTPRPMSSLRYRWKRSTGRGYQRLQGWLWCAHTDRHLPSGLSGFPHTISQGQPMCPAAAVVKSSFTPSEGWCEGRAATG
jgi:hypothetical protein